MEPQEVTTAFWSEYLDARENFYEAYNGAAKMIRQLPEATEGERKYKRDLEVKAGAMEREFHNLKELFYTALNSKATFVPDLAGRYQDEVDDALEGLGFEE